MPLPLTVDTDGDLGVRVIRSDGDVIAQAIVHDHELAPAIFKNGETGLSDQSFSCTYTCLYESTVGYILTPQRTDEIIDLWFVLFQASDASAFAQVSHSRAEWSWTGIC